MDLPDANGFVIADIPGLIEGASEGVGLGHEFLRHIERTKLMIHVVDAAGTEGRDPVDDIYKINNELKAYNADIANRPQVIAANKIDAIFTDDDPVQRLKDEFEPQGVKGIPDFRGNRTGYQGIALLCIERIAASGTGYDHI